MMKIMRKIVANKIVKNASWLIGGKIAQMAINLAVGLLAARYLGPSNYGLINYGTAYTAFFMSLCTLGINSVIVKEFLDHPQKEGMILGTSLLLKGMSSVISALMIYIIVSFVDADEPTTIAVVGLCSIGMIFNIFDTFNYWFQSQLKSKITAICSLIAFAVTALYKVVLLIAGKSVVYFAIATSIDYICIGMLLFLAYLKESGGKLKFSWEYGKSLLKASTPFIIPGLMVAIYGQTDKLMLKQMISQTEIGYYSTAVSICTIWGFVISAIIDSMFPGIMEANKHSEKEFAQKNKIMYAIVFWVCIAFSLLICLLAPIMINVLYGSAYTPSVNPLRIVTWYSAFSYLGVARNAWIVCKKKQQKLKYVYAAAALSNVILNLILIPQWGASGAAMASLIAQVMTTMIVPFFIPSLRENSILMLEAIIFKIN